MNDADREVLGEYLDRAVLFKDGNNLFADGYWCGRAVEYANQNAIDNDWLRRQFELRNLDEAVVEVPKPDFRGQG